MPIRCKENPMRTSVSVTLRLATLCAGIGSLPVAASAQAKQAHPEAIPYVRPPVVAARTRPTGDIAHPPPAPGAGPKVPYRPGSAIGALPQNFPADAEQEDTENLVEMWKHRRSPRQFQAVVGQSLAMPREPRAAAPKNGQIQFDAAVTGGWSQIGAGDINNDGVHHQSGRERGSAYAWDNSQGISVLWLGSTGGGLWKAILLGIFGAVFVPVSDNLPGSP
jgi:hypothetical protein